jgi:hypothetical protein
MLSPAGPVLLLAAATLGPEISALLSISCKQQQHIAHVENGSYSWLDSLMLLLEHCTIADIELTTTSTQDHNWLTKPAQCCTVYHGSCRTAYTTAATVHAATGTVPAHVPVQCLIGCLELLTAWPCVPAPAYPPAAVSAHPTSG